MYFSGLNFLHYKTYHTNYAYVGITSGFHVLTTTCVSEELKTSPYTMATQKVVRKEATESFRERRLATSPRTGRGVCPFSELQPIG